MKLRIKLQQIKKIFRISKDLVLHLIPYQIRSYNSVLYSSKIKNTTNNKLKDLTFLEDTFCNLKPLMIIYTENDPRQGKKRK